MSLDRVFEPHVPEAVPCLQPLEEQHQHLAPALGHTVEEEHVFGLVLRHVPGVVCSGLTLPVVEHHTQATYFFLDSGTSRYTPLAAVTAQVRLG